MKKNIKYTTLIFCTLVFLILPACDMNNCKDWGCNNTVWGSQDYCKSHTCNESGCNNRKNGDLFTGRDAPFCGGDACLKYWSPPAEWWCETEGCNKSTLDRAKFCYDCRG